MRRYSWCCLCRRELPRNVTLTTHLQNSHDLDLIPGCPECFYFRTRTGDVRKHASRNHRALSAASRENFRWGLVRFQKTYKELTPGEVVEYPLLGEEQSAAQKDFIAATPVVVVPEVQSRTSRSPAEKKRRSRRHPRTPARSLTPSPEVRSAPGSRQSVALTTEGDHSPHPAGQAPPDRHDRWSLRQRSRERRERETTATATAEKQPSGRGSGQQASGPQALAASSATQKKSKKTGVATQQGSPSPRRKSCKASAASQAESTPRRRRKDPSPIKVQQFRARTLSESSSSLHEDFEEVYPIRLNLSADLAAATTRVETASSETQTTPRPRMVDAETQVAPTSTAEADVQTDIHLEATDSALVLPAGMFLRISPSFPPDT